MKDLLKVIIDKMPGNDLKTMKLAFAIPVKQLFLN